MTQYLKQLFYMILFASCALQGHSASAEEVSPKKIIARTYIRFSVVTEPNRSAWNATRSAEKAEHLSREAAVKAKILNPERLDMRFHLFEHVCLPALKAMRIPKDMDHQFVLLTSDVMPQPYQDRLSALITTEDRHFRIVPCGYKEDFILKSNQILFEELKAGNHTHLMSIRLDDDDALPAHFLESLLTDAPLVQWSGFISYPQGAFLYMNKSGQAQFGIGYRWERGSAGMAMICPLLERNPTRKPNIFQHGNHVHIKATSIERPLMFLRLGHGKNDQGNLLEKPGLKGYGEVTERHLLYSWIQEIFGTTLNLAPDYNMPPA